MKEDFRVRAVKRISRRERVLCLSAALDSFSSDDGIDWCRIGLKINTIDLSSIRACLHAMAKALHRMRCQLF